jgi:hypothetical protein
MIPLGDARTNPWAVMVVYGDATVTDAAVVHARGLHDVASWTLLAYDFILVYLLRLFRNV